MKDDAIGNEELAALFTGEIPYRRNLTFYLDENLDSRVYQWLCEEDVPVTSVNVLGKCGEMDAYLLADARQRGCIFVTADRDFHSLHTRIGAIEGAAHAGIILLQKPHRRTPATIAAHLVRFSQKYSDAPGILRNQVFDL